MEYCPGGDLRQLLRRSARVLTEEQVRFYGAQILLALEHMHRRGLIHQDLKPENILIDKDGYIKVTDFGLSRAESDSQCPAGTYPYLSPETLAGLPSSHAVDWWCLGCILFELRVGVPCFRGADRAAASHNILTK